MTTTTQAARVSGTIRTLTPFDLADRSKLVESHWSVEDIREGAQNLNSGMGFSEFALRQFAEAVLGLIAAIQPDPEPQPRACPCICHRQPGVTHIVACCDQPPIDPFSLTSNAVPHTATPSSAGMVSVEAAARVLLDSCPNPIFDQLKPALMGEVTERVGYIDDDDREAYYDRPVSWDAMKTIISAALRAIAGEGGR